MDRGKRIVYFQRSGIFSSLHNWQLPPIAPVGHPASSQGVSRGKKSQSPISQPRAKQPNLPMIFCICFSLLSSLGMLPLCSSASEEPPAETTDINLRNNSDRGGKSSINPNKIETIWQKEENLLRDHFVLPATSAQAVRGVSTGAAFLYSTAHSAQFSLGFFSFQYCFVYYTKAGGLLLK